MTKPPIPLIAKDLAQFTRALARQLGETAPSHLTLMNMLARAAGFQNLSHLQAAQVAEILPIEPPAPPPVDMRKITRVLQQFDAQGRLVQWPAKRNVQILALWVLWAALPAGQKLQEREISEIIDREHLFKDSAILRRDLIGCGMVSRKVGAVDYLRIEQEPPAEAKALIQAVTARRKMRGA